MQAEADSELTKLTERSTARLQRLCSGERHRLGPGVCMSFGREEELYLAAINGGGNWAVYIKAGLGADVQNDELRHVSMLRLVECCIRMRAYDRYCIRYACMLK